MPKTTEMNKTKH